MRPYRRRKSTKATPDESSEQQEFIQWLGRHRKDLLWWHTPNGGSSAAQRGRDARNGAQAGIPDLFVVQRDPMSSEAVRAGPPEGTEDIATYLRTVFNELRDALTLRDYLSLLRHIGLTPMVGVELKRKRPYGKLDDSYNQDKWIQRLTYSGIETVVSHGVNEAKAAIKELFGG